MPLTAVVTKLTFYISLWILCVLIEFSVCYTSHSTGEYEKKKKRSWGSLFLKIIRKKKAQTIDLYYKLEIYISMKKLHKCCVARQLEKEKQREAKTGSYLLSNVLWLSELMWKT